MTASASTRSGDPTPRVVLRVPTLEDEPEFLRAHRATSPGYPSFLHFYEEGMPLRRYLAILEDVRHGRHLVAAGVVPETFLFAFVGPRIVGRSAIRHWLTPSLERVGGHIGYVVVPESRRRGYATAILRLSLDIARDTLGLRRVLVTCDDTNVGSIRTIEKNGGILDSATAGITAPAGTRRYWIDLA